MYAGVTKLEQLLKMQKPKTVFVCVEVSETPLEGKRNPELESRATVPVERIRAAGIKGNIDVCYVIKRDIEHHKGLPSSYRLVVIGNRNIWNNIKAAGLTLMFTLEDKYSPVDKDLPKDLILE